MTTAGKTLRTVEHEVRFKLANDDLRDRGHALGDAKRALEKAQSDFADVKRDWSVRIRNAEKEFERLVAVLETGEEGRMTKCDEVLVGRRVIFTRQDNGAKVGERAATDDELQDDLPGMTPPGAGIVDGKGKGRRKKAGSGSLDLEAQKAQAMPASGFTPEPDAEGDVVVGDIAAPRGKSGKN